MIEVMQKDLLTRLKLGEPRAVQEWYEEYSPRLLAYISKKVSSQKDCEEITQEVFLGSLKHLPLFRGGSSIFTWMCSIARHEIADYYRKLYAKKALKYVPLGEMILQENISDAHESAEKVKEVLSQMKDESKELLLKKYVDCKKVTEISIELGRTTKSIESDLFRARKEFKKLYALAV
ncbi:RNA polymerase sigma factor [Candidatus Pacearchaeota archaeon]|nr:RNA polymerase sigma factor [Candidatus Pacearchaeota archaeon]